MEHFHYTKNSTLRAPRERRRGDENVSSSDDCRGMCLLHRELLIHAFHNKKVKKKAEEEEAVKNSHRVLSIEMRNAIK
jgi:hypothetical protein